jgi:alpha/beta hydrolase fold
MYARSRPPIGDVLRPFFSPLHATAAALAQQPPTLVLTAQIDVARGEGERYVQLLNSAALAETAAAATDQHSGNSAGASATAAAAAAAASASAADVTQQSSDSVTAAAAASTTAGATAATVAAGTVKHKCVQLPRAVRGFFGRTRHEGGKSTLQEAERFIGLHCGVSHLLEND